MANFDLERIRSETGVGGLEHHAKIGSTNDRGLELVKRDASSEIKLSFPFLILADVQTAGRGQFHRPWISETGNLTCTLCALSYQDQPDSLLPLAVGLGVCEALENVVHNIQVKLKWPNDLLIGERKVGGILIEQNSGRLVIGIGLNVNRKIDLNQSQLSKDPHETREFQQPALEAISILETSGQEVNLTELTIEVFKQVMEKTAWLVSGRQEVLDRCQQRMIFRDREIELTLADGKRIAGPYRGLTDAGELLIETQGSRIAIASAVAIRW